MTTRTLHTMFVVAILNSRIALTYLVQLLSMKRVGILHGGVPHGLDEKAIPPAQRLRIANYHEIFGSPGSSTALSDGENGIL